MFRIGDTGTAARFFPQFAPDPPFRYCAKAPRSERWFWCCVCAFADSDRAAHEDHAMHCETCNVDFAHGDKAHKGHKTHPNTQYHPTQKPESLMRWLVRLVTPPGGIILDCFAGSGATGVAAVQEGFRAVLIDSDPESVGIAKARVAHAVKERMAQIPLFAEAT